jgi:hypothetical protein
MKRLAVTFVRLNCAWQHCEIVIEREGARRAATRGAHFLLRCR